MKSVRLTKRLQRQYQKVLQGTASSWFYPHPMAYFGTVGSWTKDSPAWQAYLFAKEWGGREGVDLKRLEGTVARGGSAECAYLFARNVRGASVKKLQKTVVRLADPEYIRKFMGLPGANRGFLERFLIVAEVMNG